MTCNRVVIINNGKVVAMDTPAGLTNQMKGAEKIAISVIGPQSEVLETIRSIGGVMGVQAENAANASVNYTVECKLQTELAAHWPGKSLPAAGNFSSCAASR